MMANVKWHGQLMTIVHPCRWRCWWLEMTAHSRPAASWGAAALQALCSCTRLRERQRQAGTTWRRCSPRRVRRRRALAAWASPHQSAQCPAASPPAPHGTAALLPTAMQRTSSTIPLGFRVYNCGIADHPSGSWHTLRQPQAPCASARVPARLYRKPHNRTCS